MPQAPEQPFRLNPLLFALFCGTMAMMAFPALIGPVIRRFSLSELVAGVAVAAGGIFWMLSARWWGKSSDIHGRKPVLLFCMGIFTLTSLATALFIDAALRTPALIGLVALVLIVVRSLIGAFYAAVPAVTAAAIADNTPAELRPAFMAKLGSASALGMVVGPAIIGWAAGNGLQYGFYVAALLPLLGFLGIAFLFPRQAPSLPSVEPTHPKDLVTAPKKGLTLFDKRLRLASLTAFTAMLAVSIAQVCAGFFVMDRLGLNEEQGAQVTSIALSSVGLSLIVAQQFVIRFRTVEVRHWLVGGLVIACCGFASIPFVGSQSALYSGYAIAGFGMGFVFPSFQTMTANAVLAHEQGAAAGTVSSVQGFGVVIGPLLGTLLYKLQANTPYIVVSCCLLLLALSFFRPPSVSAANDKPQEKSPL